MDKLNRYFEAVKKGDKKLIKDLYKEDFLNKCDGSGLNTMHWVCLNNQMEILAWLLKQNVDINYPTQHGARAIHLAIFRGHANIVKLLIDNYSQLAGQTDNLEFARNPICSQKYVDEILQNNYYLQIGLIMGLKCNFECNHKFCLTSMIHCNFEKGELIGEGTFSKIFKVEDRLNERSIATKRFYITRDSRQKYILENVNTFRNIITHSNIIKYFQMIQLRGKCCIFMECMEKGSLYDEIKSSGQPLQHTKTAKYCRNILQAVNFLHKKRIIHRNINPSNILIDGNGGCKLSMSLISCSLNVDNDIENADRATMFCGTIQYMAPEILNYEPYSYPVDIWSVGATVVHMLTGNPPYHDVDKIVGICKIRTNRKLEFSLIDQLTEDMQKFIDDMLKSDANQRATAEDLLNYDFFTNIQNDLIINSNNNNSKMEDDKSIFDDSSINRTECINLIKSAIDNKKIGLAIKLTCSSECDHKFCISSVTANNFKKEKFVGEGIQGIVYKIKDSLSNREIIMKCTNFILNEEIKNADSYCDKINNYLDLLKNERILEYYGAIRREQELFIFMENIENITIKDQIKKRRTGLPEDSVKRYIRQILEGLKFLHDLKIMHRDIRSENVFIVGDDNIKLSDFVYVDPVSTIIDKEAKNQIGCANYISPEVANGDPYDFPSDIWAGGALVFEMLTGQLPYHNFRSDTVVEKIRSLKKLEIPDNLPKKMKHLLDHMLKSDPKIRASARKLLKYGYLTSDNKSSQ